VHTHHTPTVTNYKTQQRKSATYASCFLHKTYLWCKFTPNLMIMARQSISFTQPNDEWLKIQVDNKEYSSKSEARVSL